MLRPLIQPQHRIRNILRRNRLHVFIHLRRPAVVALKAHVGKLSSAAQARLHIAHPHPRALQICPQIERKLADESLGRAVDIAARIRISARYRTDIDDVAVAPRRHLRQHQTGQVRQSEHIGFNHRFPIGKIGAVGRIQSQSQAAVVNQAVDFAKRRRQAFQRRRNRRPVGQIQFERIKRPAQFVAQALQFIHTPCRADHAEAGPYKSPAHRFAEARRCAGNQNRHFFLLSDGRQTVCRPVFRYDARFKNHTERGTHESPYRFCCSGRHCNTGGLRRTRRPCRRQRPDFRRTYRRLQAYDARIRRYGENGQRRRSIQPRQIQRTDGRFHPKCEKTVRPLPKRPAGQRRRAARRMGATR